MNETELRNKFVHFLMENKGFSNETIRQEVILPKGARADLVSWNPSDGLITAIFEFKVSSKNLDNAALQVLKYKRLLASKNIPAFIVTPSNHEKDEFNIYVVSDNAELNIIDNSNLPDFNSLLSSLKTLNKAENKAETEKTIDKFKLLCFFLSLVMVLILVLDISNCFKLTSHQLTLLGLAIALALIPYAAKLKILGIEFERIDKK